MQISRYNFYCQMHWGTRVDTMVYIKRAVQYQSTTKWTPLSTIYPLLTHWGRATHICVSKLTIIGSENGLSPGRRQAIIWTNDGILLIGPFGTNFSEILIEIYAFSFKKIDLKMSSGKWRPLCLGLNVLKHAWQIVNAVTPSEQHWIYTWYINTLLCC